MEAKDWDARYAAGRQWSVEPNRWVVAELAGAPTGRALDAACGEGRNAIWLAEQGWSVVGVDFSQVALERAAQVAAAAVERRGQPLDLTWVCADVTADLAAAGVGGEAFDLVLVSYVQLPSYQRLPLLRACAAALKPGGTLLVIAHDSTNLAQGWGGPQDPANLYTAADVESDLQDQIATGVLSIERSGRVAREVETEDGVKVAWDALFRARRRTMGQGTVA